MPRSAIDATRFTPTTPHASANPSNAPTRAVKGAKMPFPSRTPGPPGETPMEKVARLRAAAARAREAQFTTADRVVSVGRVWADRLHVFTARSLIAITGVVGVVTVYSLGDMMVYNRRKRREYFAEQKAAREAQLHDAQVAFSSGIASEPQILLLQEESAAEVSRVQDVTPKTLENKKDGITKSVWGWLTSDLKKEEEGEDVGTAERRLGYESTSEEDDVLGVRDSDVVRAIEEKKSAIQEKAKQAFEKEKALHRDGGPLDRIGTDSGSAEAEKKGGWMAFMSRK